MGDRTLLRSWTKDDFVLEWFSGTGAGGQHRNKHQNCLRLREKGSGLVVVAQGNRSRRANLREAFEKMGPMLVSHYFPKEEKARAPVSEHVRTYNLCTNRVVDISSGQKWLSSEYEMDEGIIARKTVEE